MKLNATNRNTLTAIVIIFCLLSVLATFAGARVRSEYQPRPINIETSEEGEASLFDLPHNIDCVPGSKQSSYYTKSLSPGGICGDQVFVRNSANAKIVGGIGGSLI